MTNRDIIKAEGKRKPGRPRKDRPERAPGFVVQVWDRRPEMQHKMIAEFPLIPGDWTIEMILKRLGIADHLVVLRREIGGPYLWTTIQHGRT